MNNIEVVIQNGDTLYMPSTENEITWETVRKGSPGSLKLNILKDQVIDFQEGNPIRVKVNGVNVFYGFVFKKERNSDGVIKVTAYDQLRYFKNKDTYIYENKTASEIIRMIAKDFNLQCGDIEDTKFKIGARIEEDKTLFDISLNALDETIENAKEMYVLYDDFGKLTLKNINSMRLDTLIDKDLLEDFSYCSSIDSNTYNKIKICKKNEKEGTREVYIAQDSKNINNWGVLQYYETVDENVNAQAKVNALLKLYNHKFRTLNLKNVLGDIRVRAGCLLAVNLNLGDMIVQNFMLVDNVKHTFNNTEHFMDLTLVGGEFVSTLASGSGAGRPKPKNTGSDSGYQPGREVPALFTAYYPANNKMEGGFFDAMGNRLNPSNNTCAAPKSIPFKTKIQVKDTNTNKDGEVYTVTDRGGAINVKNGVYHFDLLMSSRSECNKWGKRHGKAVILTKSNGSSSSINKINKLIDVAKSKLGCPYVWGATGPRSFDCSGLTQYCYRQIGISIPRTSSEQGRSGTYVSKNNLKPGDLVFFKHPISHVGLYIGNGQMIHSPQSGDVVKVANINSSYFSRNYNTARRFL